MSLLCRRLPQRVLTRSFSSSSSSYTSPTSTAFPSFPTPPSKRKGRPPNDSNQAPKAPRKPIGRPRKYPSLLPPLPPPEPELELEVEVGEEEEEGGGGLGGLKRRRRKNEPFPDIPRSPTSALHVSTERYDKKRKGARSPPSSSQAPISPDEGVTPILHAASNTSASVEAHEEDIDIKPYIYTPSPLPPHLQWRKHFSATGTAIRDRVSIANPRTAAELANAFVGPGERDRVIIEAYPGPGALTRALLQLPKERIKKLIIVEDHKPYLEYLTPLEKTDPRVTIVPANAWAWETYQMIQAQGLLNEVEKIPWDAGVHPHLQFISHLPMNIHGEQLASQLFRSIPDQQWLFQYGRIPMNFLMSDFVWNRISAPPASLTRCKLSIIAQATCSLTLTTPPSLLTPYNDHFHPRVIHGDYDLSQLPSSPPPSPTSPVNPKRRSASSASSEPEDIDPLTTFKKRIQTRHPGFPFVACTSLPSASQAISRTKLDKWDYVLRRLFVLKASPLHSALPSLAPGAKSLLKVLSGEGVEEGRRVDPEMQIRRFEVRDWERIVRAFDEWPFAPEDLLITDGFRDGVGLGPRVIGMRE